MFSVEAQHSAAKHIMLMWSSAAMPIRHSIDEVYKGSGILAGHAALEGSQMILKHWLPGSSP